MNKYQESLMGKYQNALKITNEAYKEYYHSNKTVCENGLDPLIDLVERATPKKPLNIGYDDILYNKYGRCPRCNMTVFEYSCCSNNACRQALDWSDK